MELSKILSYCDHTLLSQTATFDEIKVIIDDAIKYGCASVCIPPALVKRASEYAGGRMKICTVIGFPNGYSTEAVKVFETREAVREGADEIDMVINVGLLKEGNLEALLSEINAVKREAGERILKVIIETCFLTEEEKIAISGVVARSNADFIKTSTGFGTGGATREDVALLRANTPGKKVKAAGGIASVKDAEDFITLGAERLGTSRLVKIARNEKGFGY